MTGPWRLFRKLVFRNLYPTRLDSERSEHRPHCDGALKIASVIEVRAMFTGSQTTLESDNARFGELLQERCFHQIFV